MPKEIEIGRHENGILKGCAYFKLRSSQKVFTPTVKTIGRFLCWLFNSEDSHTFKSFGGTHKAKAFIHDCVNTPPNMFHELYEKYCPRVRGDE